ncbi:MAG: glycerol-3-phosphate dehydrogenase [Actinomycetota bacterium]|nr:glycerol-3-phosphate dehydrogenase [Actinomycetota bacterium]
MIGPGWFDRSEAIRRLADDHFDVLVVGGGITGAGTALDAASRGLRTALVERHDFASGTSSKSSKLVHGGLRYLQQGEFLLVYEALHERQRLRHNAPHLVKIMPFLLPVFSGRGGVIPKKLSRALGSAMWLYDLTGGARIGRLHQRITPDEAVAHMPTLNRERLASSYLYYDAQADDARLTLTLARTAAVDFGAVVANGVALVAVEKGPDGRVSGARLRADGAEITVGCSAIVNATGVWADDVRALDEGRDPDSIRPAKGIHITVPWSKVRNDIAAVIPVPKDKRSVFVVPWGDFTYIGTTDTDYDGPVDDPQCTAADVAYLLGAINHAVTTEITERDVVGTWAGLRPLVKSAENVRTADLSRRHKVHTSESGMVTITGGKLTTYRRMAADTIDVAVGTLGVRARSRTTRVRLSGAYNWDHNGLSQHLAGRYGSNGEAVRALEHEHPELAAPIVPGLDYSKAEVVYAARAEMARSVDDVLARRTRARLLARDASASAAAEVARLIAPELGWSTADQDASIAAYQALVDAERASAQLPETALDAALGA